MPLDIPILSLSPQLTGLLERVAHDLNGQDRFHFRVVGTAAPPDPDRGEAYSFDLLDRFLLAEMRRLGVARLLGVMSRPNEPNYFSHSRWADGVGFVTTFGWEYLSWLPVESFVGYAVVRNAVTILGGRRSFHQETRGCLFDFCGHKPDYAFKIRTADICPECLGDLQGKLDPADLAAVIALLERVRLIALGRGKPAPPVTSRSLPEAIDREYPFPIAYCFRSMQAELSYSRKWLKLLELYEVAVKYLTFVLLASVRQAEGGVPATVAPQLAGLRRPTAGHWHQACFALLKACADSAAPVFVADFCRHAGGKGAKHARAASEQLLPLRNHTKGHGFVEEEPQYRARYEANLSAIQALMEFVRPLAAFHLIKVGEGMKRRGGVSTFPAKLLMGSHPLFPVTEHQTPAAVDTDCLLYDPAAGGYLSLFPWLQFDHCGECFRETVFLYDRLDPNGAVVLEYPTNHVQTRDIQLPPDLLQLME